MGIITEEPTCERLLAMQGEVSGQLLEWAKRDASVPVSAWTADQHQLYETAARVFRAEADQLVVLARETPHRVIREIYEQIIAYDRAYSDAIPHYGPADNDLALVRNDLSATQFNICEAIASFAAANRGPSVQEAAPPTTVASIADLAEPQRFLTGASGGCPKIKAWADRKQLELELWFKTAKINVPATQRSATDGVVWDTAGKVLSSGAGELDQIARSSDNPVMEDFVILTAQYYRAFVAAIPTFVPADNQLYEVAQKSQVSVLAACRTVGG